jgi:2-keto-4-pentenoate hydratase/2-oxohepta-3-ene-1,7-dioic acid hydratase in catechol pathway
VISILSWPGKRREAPSSHLKSRPSMRQLDKPGDTMESEISGIGVLRNKVAAGT